jgi:hypothetical protein
MRERLTKDDIIEFDCEIIDGTVVKKSGRIIYADGRIRPLQLSRHQDQNSATSRDRLIGALDTSPGRRRLSSS